MSIDCYNLHSRCVLEQFQAFIIIVNEILSDADVIFVWSLATLNICRDPSHSRYIMYVPHTEKKNE